MLKNPTILAIFLVIGIFLCLPKGWSADEAVPSSNELQAEPIVTEDAKISDEGVIDLLAFQEVDIQQVLRTLAYKSGMNIVSGPEVTGPVTIRLENVPWKQALEVILQTYGYAYEQKGAILTVTTVENLKKRRADAADLADQEPVVTKTFILNYATASKIIVSVEKMMTKRGSVNFDERTNAIIVTDIAQNIELISDVIVKLDATTPQVLIEAKIVETTMNNKENLGIDWVTKATLSAGKRPTTWPFTASSASKYIKSDDFPGAEDTDFSYGTINFAQLQAVLELLRTRTDTNILSNPRIVTLDNQTARIIVGSQYPIPNYVYNEQQAKLQVNGFEYKDIGIIFQVTPHINNAGYVTMELEPKITEILDFVTVENTSLPRLSTEEAKTSVMIKDGETLVIAGLIKDTGTDIKKRTPFLGDIPVLGLLFHKSEKTVEKKDLLIFLTPHIITVDQPPAEK